MEEIEENLNNLLELADKKFDLKGAEEEDRLYQYYRKKLVENAKDICYSGCTCGCDCC